MKSRFLLLLIYITLSNCSFFKGDPESWYTLPEPRFEIPPYAKYLAGVNFCLDPGHGGDAHIPNYKRGPTGVREAAINLRVAYLLKEFLETSGAEVIMTRTGDSLVSLEDRAEIANRNDVHFFVSLHHNASNNPQTNYTSTWYHADADHSPASLDLARYIQQGVSEALRLPQFLPTGLSSDYLIYPSGLTLLRQLKVVGILCEASFHSNPEEEKRLTDLEYNKREAYGYFVGIARYVMAGFPNAELIQPEPGSTVSEKTPLIRLKLNDGLHEREGAWKIDRKQIFTNSILLKVDGQQVPHRLVRDENIIEYRPDSKLSNGYHSVETEMTNYYGNHNLPKVYRFKVSPPADRLAFETWTDTIPADGKSYTAISVTAIDSDGKSIADDEEIHLTTTNGHIDNKIRSSKSGGAVFYLYSNLDSGPVTVTAKVNGKTNSKELFFGSITKSFVQGRIIRSDTNEPLINCSILLNGEKSCSMTNSDGHFFTTTSNQEILLLTFQKTGFYTLLDSLFVAPGEAHVIDHRLEPVASGLFHNLTFILDPRFGGSETGTPISSGFTSSKLNLTVAKDLMGFLKAAGADVYLTRTDDIFLSVENRIDQTNKISGQGYYIRIDHDQWQNDQPFVTSGHYPGKEDAIHLLSLIHRRLSKSIGDTVVASPEAIENPDNGPEIWRTNKWAMSLGISSIKNPLIQDNSIADSFAKFEAYQIFLAMYEHFKGDSLSENSLKIKILDKNDDSPIPNTMVWIDDTFSLETDQNGEVEFLALNPRNFRITVDRNDKKKITKMIKVKKGRQIIIMNINECEE